MQKEPSLPRQRSGVSDVSEEGCTLGTSKSLPMIKSAKKSLFPHSGHHQSQNGSTSMIAGGNSLMGAGNSLMGGGSSWMGGGGGSLMGGGGSLLAPYGGMSMVSIGDASSHGSFMQGHPSMKNMPPGAALLLQYGTVCMTLFCAFLGMCGCVKGSRMPSCLSVGALDGSIE